MTYVNENVTSPDDDIVIGAGPGAFRASDFATQLAQNTNKVDWIINAKEFGASEVLTPTENESAIQSALNATKPNGGGVVLVNYGIEFNVKNLILPNNIVLEYYQRNSSNSGNFEKVIMTNSIDPNGTPVNEFIIKAPYHSGLIIDTDNDIASEVSIPQTNTTNAQSIVFRKKGESKFAITSGMDNEDKLHFRGYIPSLKYIMTLATSGVGIGNVVPAYPLDVNGVSRLEKIFFGKDPYIREFSNTNGDLYITTPGRSNYTVRMLDINSRKQSAFEINTDAGWSTPQVIRTGRPANVLIGSQSFDTTLGIPIWWNGTSWVNATGTPV
jgi:hypothetical protein